MTIPVLPVGDVPAPRSLGVRPLGDAPLVVIDPERHAAADRPAAAAAGRGPRRPLRRAAGQRGRSGGGAGAHHRRPAAPGRHARGAGRPPDPLDRAGRQVVEDLLLLDAADERVPLVAGSLCFPNGWEIRGALGRSFAEIHAPVPGFARGHRRRGARADAATAPRPAGVAGQLDPAHDRRARHVPRRRAAATARRRGPASWCGSSARRSRAWRTREAVLFTVHTRSRPLGEVAADPARARRLRDTLTSMPSAMRDYKGITDLVAPASRYLEERLTGAS